MRNLLSANLKRLWLNKTFWVTVILMISMEFFCGLILKHNTMTMDFVLFLSLQGIGVLTAVFFSLFTGTEYSDGTIRNKLIIGHKRSSIYFASFITGIIAMTVIYLAGILTGYIIGLIWFEPSHYTIVHIIIAGIIGWLACVSYISIFNLVGMVSSAKARTSIICLLTAFLLILLGLIFYALLSGSQNTLYQFIFEMNPFGQTVETISIMIDSPWKLVAYSSSLISVVTGIGLYYFSKKDLK